MTVHYSWESPASRLVLTAVLDTLAAVGHQGLSVEEIRARAGTAGEALEDEPDVDALVIAALGAVRLFRTPEPTGSLRGDLRALLRPWLGPHSRDERVVAAVLSIAEWDRRMKQATFEALDRPLAQAIGGVLSRHLTAGQVPPRRVHTLSWILRSLTLDRLRSAAPRTPVDLEQLIDHLLAGLPTGTDSAQPAC
ncbi:MAG TPA: hypothetical protein VHF92_05240 [Geodermatophilus sp.]|nr:hypothetical protein [Geodermatophilus sp.]